MINFGDIKHRQAVIKLRISSHRLPVESGRYNIIPFDKRTCKLCNLNEVGNEQHYLMQCSNTLLKEIRYSFTQKLYTKLLYGFEESCILIGRRAVRKNPYSDRGP